MWNSNDLIQLIVTVCLLVMVVECSRKRKRNFYAGKLVPPTRLLMVDPKESRRMLSNIQDRCTQSSTLDCVNPCRPFTSSCRNYMYFVDIKHRSHYAYTIIHAQDMHIQLYMRRISLQFIIIISLIHTSPLNPLV